MIVAFPSYTQLLRIDVKKKSIFLLQSQLKAGPISVHFKVALIRLEEKQCQAVFENVLNKP